MSMVVIWKGRAFWPSMTRVASEMKLQFIVLLMKGKDREALRGVKPLRYAIDATRLHQRRRWAVSGPILGRFGRDAFEIQKETSHAIVRWPRVHPRK